MATRFTTDCHQKTKNYTPIKTTKQMNKTINIKQN